MRLINMKKEDKIENLDNLDSLEDSIWFNIFNKLAMSLGIIGLGSTILVALNIPILLSLLILTPTLGPLSYIGITKLKEKDFPIDADRLINNYFRVAQKDPDGSFEALTKNPAMFSPIEFDKIRPKFFGLIKVTPEDGIKANQKIGKFVKNLKV